MIFNFRIMLLVLLFTYSVICKAQTQYQIGTTIPTIAGSIEWTINQSNSQIGKSKIIVSGTFKHIYITQPLPVITDTLEIDLMNSNNERVHLHFRDTAQIGLWFQNKPFKLKNAILSVDTFSKEALVSFSRTIGANVGYARFENVSFIGGIVGIVSNDNLSGHIDSVSIKNCTFASEDIGIQFAGKESGSSVRLLNPEILGCAFSARRDLMGKLSFNIVDYNVKRPFWIDWSSNLRIAYNTLLYSVDDDNFQNTSRIRNSYRFHFQNNHVSCLNTLNTWTNYWRFTGLVLSAVDTFNIRNNTFSNYQPLLLNSSSNGTVTDNYFNTSSTVRFDSVSEHKKIAIWDSTQTPTQLLSIIGGLYTNNSLFTYFGHGHTTTNILFRDNLFANKTVVNVLSGTKVRFDRNYIDHNGGAQVPFNIRSNTHFSSPAPNGNYRMHELTLDTVIRSAFNQIKVTVGDVHLGDTIHLYLVKDTAKHLHYYLGKRVVTSSILSSPSITLTVPRNVGLTNYKQLAATRTAPDSGTSEITYKNIGFGVINLNASAAIVDTAYCTGNTWGADSVVIKVKGFPGFIDSSYISIGSTRRQLSLLRIDSADNSCYYVVTDVASGTYVLNLVSGPDFTVNSLQLTVNEVANNPIILARSVWSCNPSAPFRIAYRYRYKVPASSIGLHNNKHEVKIMVNGNEVVSQVKNDGDSILVDIPGIPSENSTVQISISPLVSFKPEPCANCYEPICPTTIPVAIPKLQLYHVTNSVTDFKTCGNDSSKVKIQWYPHPIPYPVLPIWGQKFNITLTKQAANGQYSPFSFISSNLSINPNIVANSKLWLDSVSLPRGKYLVTVNWDGDFTCSRTDSFTIDYLTQPYQVNVVTRPSSCAEGGASGTATVLLNGGADPQIFWYRRRGTTNSYNLIPNLQGPTAIDLASGFYRLRLIDPAGCVHTHNFMIDSIKAPDKPEIKVDSGTCVTHGKLVRSQNEGSFYTFIWSVRKPGRQYQVVHRQGISIQNPTQTLIRDTLPTMYLPDSGMIMLAVENNLGCRSLADSALYVKPVVNRHISICLRWGKPVFEAKPATPVTTLAPVFDTTRASFGIQNSIASCLALASVEVSTKILACNDPSSYKDTLTIDYHQPRQQVTLYYYNRAGQLVSTVPPEGVERLKVKPKNRSEVANYTLATHYEYSTTGQLIAQTSPDAGKQVMLYNLAGQLRISQNAQQKIDREFTYIKYDFTGNVVEKGVVKDSLNTFADSLSQYYNQLDVVRSKILHYDTIMAYNVDRQVPNLATSRFKVLEFTKTTYTDPLPGIVFRGQGQQNLIGKISTTTTRNRFNNRIVTTYYSYDPHGNVDWFATNIPGLGIKYVAYTYDLLSAKVLTMSYNPGFRDQYFVKYDYDEDDRIVSVMTSPDSVHWERDATYDYYSHGPLRRAVLGHYGVQGVDYAYTINGWLKGINSPIGGVPELDLGKDGHELNPYSTHDAFAMGLHYFKGDYNADNSFTLVQPEISLGHSFKGLYNGNIAAWSQFNKITPDSSSAFASLEHFRYDKLNRIVSSNTKSFSYNVESGKPSFSETNDAFATSYQYDANGNLQHLHRNNEEGQTIDSLIYKYYPNSNKLHKVKDYATLDGINQDDPTDTVTFEYDAIGQLIVDHQQKARIYWNDNGKVVAVLPLNSTSKQPKIFFVYDGLGNRVAETVRHQIDGVEFDSLTTYQVRDLTGNALSIYEKHYQLGVLDDEPSGGTGPTDPEETQEKSAPPGGGVGSMPQPVNFTITQTETPIYGSDRIGVRRPNELVKLYAELEEADSVGHDFPQFIYHTNYVSNYELGKKSYELKDHLGNVRVVVSDKRLYKPTDRFVESGNDALSIEHGRYFPVVQHTMDYYPFGMLKKKQDDGIGATTWQPYNPGPCGLASEPSSSVGWNPNASCCMILEGEDALQTYLPVGQYRIRFQFTASGATQFISVRNKADGNEYFSGSAASNSGIINHTNNGNIVIALLGSEPGDGTIQLCNLTIEVADTVQAANYCQNADIVNEKVQLWDPSTPPSALEFMTRSKYEDNFNFCSNGVDLNYLLTEGERITFLASLNADKQHKFVLHYCDVNGTIRFTLGDLDTTLTLNGTADSVVLFFNLLVGEKFLVHVMSGHINITSLQIQEVCTTLGSMQASSYRYRYNGKEQLSRFGGRYDYGFRMYDAGLARWLSLDNLRDKYPDYSPYNFALNTPIIAKDPDGNVVIFINGQHGGTGGTHAYWGGLDKQVLAKLGDKNARYVDGALGGWTNTVSRIPVALYGGLTGAFIAYNSSNVSQKLRIIAGEAAGYKDAESIINGLSPNETIKIVSHSMGVAYSRGYMAGILKYAKEHNKDIKISYSLDINAFQGGDLPRSKAEMANSKTGGLDGVSKAAIGMILSRVGIPVTVPTVAKPPGTIDITTKAEKATADHQLDNITTEGIPENIDSKK